MTLGIRGAFRIAGSATASPATTSSVSASKPRSRRRGRSPIPSRNDRSASIVSAVAAAASSRRGHAHRPADERSLLIAHPGRPGIEREHLGQHHGESRARGPAARGCRSHARGRGRARRRSRWPGRARPGGRRRSSSERASRSAPSADRAGQPVDRPSGSPGGRSPRRTGSGCATGATRAQWVIASTPVAAVAGGWQPDGQRRVEDRSRRDRRDGGRCRPCVRRPRR